MFRAQWPRIVATLVRYTGSIELAEDATQLAFERALSSPDRALLLNPAAWITTVAKRIAIDSLRRDATIRAKYPQLANAVESSDPPPMDPGDDDRLGMLFVACTPALGPDVRLALALRFVGGLPTAEVASVMLVKHAAMNARITRAKKQIERDGIRFAALDEFDTRDRIPDVLEVIHAMYTVAHTLTSSDDLESRLLARTAVELAQALHLIAPDDREVAGLLALLLFSEARNPGRLDPDGHVVTLDNADRSLWNDPLIRHGLDLAAVALRGRGRFALEAGISGLHCQAENWNDTDWESITSLYDALVEVWPSPAAHLARIVARSYSSVGPEVALAELDTLDLPPALERQVMASRADILRRLGRAQEARAAYGLARSLEQNAQVRDFYERRLAELS